MKQFVFQSLTAVALGLSKHEGTSGLTVNRIEKIQFLSNVLGKGMNQFLQTRSKQQRRQPWLATRRLIHSYLQMWIKGKEKRETISPNKNWLVKISNGKLKA